MRNCGWVIWEWGCIGKGREGEGRNTAKNCYSKKRNENSLPFGGYFANKLVSAGGQEGKDLLGEKPFIKKKKNKICFPFDAYFANRLVSAE